ncbi:MAG: hypothetical protein OXN21_04905 [Chloroflexota bacterium]|nr:hypothetical protein [Chloroflexota bacterium]
MNHRTREIHIHYDTCFDYVHEMQAEYEWTSDWGTALGRLIPAHHPRFGARGRLWPF